MDEPNVAFHAEGKTFGSPIGALSVLGVLCLAGALLLFSKLLSETVTLSNAVPLLLAVLGGLLLLATGLAFTAMHLNAWRAGRNPDAAARRITPLVVTPGGVVIDPYLYAGDTPLPRRPRFVPWRDVAAIGAVGEKGLFPITVAEKDGRQKTVYEIPEAARSASGQLAHTTLVAARERYLAGLSSAARAVTGTFIVPVIRTAPPIWRALGGGTLLVGGAVFIFLLAATAAQARAVDLDLKAFLVLLFWSLLITCAVLAIVVAALKGWQDRGREIAWPVATIEADGFTATALPNTAGDFFGDLEGRAHRVAWPDVKHIDTAVGADGSFAIDIGERYPLRLPALAKAEDGRTLHPALTEAWQGWRRAS